MDSHRKTILIVEDEVDIQNLMKRILSVNGYSKYLIASNGQDALDILRSHKPDLIITDRMMPIMDGIEMLNIIKNTDTINDIPVIVISAIRPSEPPPSHCLWDDYIVKPITIQRLLQSVENLIGTA